MFVLKCVSPPIRVGASRRRDATYAVPPGGGLRPRQWAQCDSNTRPTGYEPVALTKLSYGPALCSSP